MITRRWLFGLALLPFAGEARALPKDAGWYRVVAVSPQTGMTRADVQVALDILKEAIARSPAELDKLMISGKNHANTCQVVGKQC